MSMIAKIGFSSLRRLLLGLIGTLAISASVIIATHHSGSTGSGVAVAVGSTANTLAPGSGLQVDGGSVTMVPTTQTPKLAPADAYAAYLKWIGAAAPFAGPPTYTYGLFSDANVQDPNGAGVLVRRWQNVPVWAVLFRGVSVVPVGKGPSNAVVNDVTYFVSDDSGAVLEELTSPVTITHTQAP